MDRYRYRISNTGYGSQRYGNCEVCGKYCSETFLLGEQKHFTDEIGEAGWTYHKCIGSLFGHKECCLAQMKTQNSIGYLLRNEPYGKFIVFDAKAKCLGEFEKRDEEAFKALTENAGL